MKRKETVPGSRAPAKSKVNNRVLRTPCTRKAGDSYSLWPTGHRIAHRERHRLLGCQYRTMRLSGSSIAAACLRPYRTQPSAYGSPGIKCRKTQAPYTLYQDWGFSLLISPRVAGGGR
eukprot:2151960-Rhodomonas_salina.1